MENFDEKAFKMKVHKVYLTIHDLFYEIIDEIEKNFAIFDVYRVLFLRRNFCLHFSKRKFLTEFTQPPKTEVSISYLKTSRDPKRP